MARAKPSQTDQALASLDRLLEGLIFLRRFNPADRGGVYVAVIHALGRRHDRLVARACRGIADCFAPLERLPVGAEQLEVAEAVANSWWTAERHKIVVRGSEPRHQFSSITLAEVYDHERPILLAVAKSLREEILRERRRRQAPRKQPARDEPSDVIPQPEQWATKLLQSIGIAYNTAESKLVPRWIADQGPARADRKPGGRKTLEEHLAERNEEERQGARSRVDVGLQALFRRTTAPRYRELRRTDAIANWLIAKSFGLEPSSLSRYLGEGRRFLGEAPRKAPPHRV